MMQRAIDVWSQGSSKNKDLIPANLNTNCILNFLFTGRRLIKEGALIGLLFTCIDINVVQKKSFNYMQTAHQPEF